MKTIKELQQQFLKNTFYKGIPTCKNPMDLWIYQEIIHEVKPDVIIEIGVWQGGSTLWLADHSNAHIIAIDKTDKYFCDEIKNREDIHLMKPPCEMGKSLKDVKGELKDLHDSGAKIMVIDDASHECQETLYYLRLLSPLVSVGSYYIVEDTIAPELGYKLYPGKAVKEFMKDNDEFEVDKSREKYITWNPGGYLKRVK